MEEGIPLEVRLLQAVEDVPGVIRLLDYFATSDTFYIVMELVEAVVGCQDSGVHHGDVKDENILVEEVELVE